MLDDLTEVGEDESPAFIADGNFENANVLELAWK